MVDELKPVQRPLLFVLEDDTHLVRDIKELAEEFDWDICCAHSVEQAVDLFTKRAKEVRLAFVDTMVPATQNDYEKLLSEMTRREAIARADVMNYNDTQLLELRSELIAIDLVIREVVDVRGGLFFLEKVESSIRKHGVRIAVFSARTPQVDSLKEMAQNVVGDANWSGWYQKPIDPEVLAAVLMDPRSAART
jgi:CheY-like chemotaxis protein